MDNEKPEPRVGQFVKWHDPTGVEHDALVTAVWNPLLVNLVVVSKDTAKIDQYGRQIERQTSSSHKSCYQAHGFYWRFSHEEPNQYTPPLER
jgi:hypothetical protein